MLKLYACCLCKSIERAKLICHISRCLLGRYIHVSAAKAHQIRIARMSTDADAGFFGHSHGLLHHHGV